MRGKKALRRKRTYPRVEMGGHHRAAVLHVPTVRGVDLEYLTAQYHNTTTTQPHDSLGRDLITSASLHLAGCEAEQDLGGQRVVAQRVDGRLHGAQRQPVERGAHLHTAPRSAAQAVRARRQDKASQQWPLTSSLFVHTTTFPELQPVTNPCMHAYHTIHT